MALFNETESTQTLVHGQVSRDHQRFIQNNLSISSARHTRTESRINIERCSTISNRDASLASGRVVGCKILFVILSSDL